MSKYQKQMLEAIKKLQQSLEAIKDDLSELKLKLEVSGNVKANSAAPALNQTNSVQSPANTIWGKYPEQYRKILSKLGGMTFEAWFGSVKSIEIQEAVLQMVVADQFYKDILESRYTDDLKEIFDVQEVEISIIEN